MAGSALLGNGHIAAGTWPAQLRFHIVADGGLVSNVLSLCNHHSPIYAAGLGACLWWVVRSERTDSKYQVILLHCIEQVQELCRPHL